MINILSYIGMDLQSEVCLWTLLGLLRTIFDATLFKVNANLKQVWQMRMPEELTRSVQRVLRTMISGVILVQCFTVYVYLASYIVLLYPVFLEERPTLLLPWLLLAAIRKLLCELMSLALGLGICVLLGPAKPPCVKFLIVKLASITPAFYIWLLVFSYYHSLKMTTAFKTFPAVLPSNDRDHGLELAVRRRRTKSLQGEDQLRRKLIENLYEERNPSVNVINPISNQNENGAIQTRDNSVEDIRPVLDVLCPLSVTSNKTISDIGTYEDWFGNEVVLPRDTDRILEQFGVMLLRIAAYLNNQHLDPVKLFSSAQTVANNPSLLKCIAVANDTTDTPPYVGSSKGKIATYLTDYPQIFMKKSSDVIQSSNSERELIQVKNTFNKTEFEKNDHNKFVNNINGQNYISYEITRQTNTIELNICDHQLTQRPLIRKSSDFILPTTKECNSKKNVQDDNVDCKTINTTCHSKSLDSNNKMESLESIKKTLESARYKKDVTESRKDNTKNKSDNSGSKF